VSREAGPRSLPPCRASSVQAVNESGKKFEVVFVSSDDNEGARLVSLRSRAGAGHPRAANSSSLPGIHERGSWRLAIAAHGFPAAR